MGNIRLLGIMVKFEDFLIIIKLFTQKIVTIH
jgi:hypothetical protein